MGPPFDAAQQIRIMQRAGRTNFATAQIYIREAETLGVTVGIPFGPLADDLCRPVEDEQSSRQSSTAPGGPAAFTTPPRKSGYSGGRVGRFLASPRGTVQ